MEAITHPLFWLILIISSVAVVLAGELGRYTTRAKYYQKHFEDYYQRLSSLDMRACRVWYLLRMKKYDEAYNLLNDVYGRKE